MGKNGNFRLGSNHNNNSLASNNQTTSKKPWTNFFKPKGSERKKTLKMFLKYKELIIWLILSSFNYLFIRSSNGHRIFSFLPRTFPISFDLCFYLVLSGFIEIPFKQIMYIKFQICLSKAKISFFFDFSKFYIFINLNYLYDMWCACSNMKNN